MASNFSPFRKSPYDLFEKSILAHNKAIGRGGAERFVKVPLGRSEKDPKVVSTFTDALDGKTDAMSHLHAGRLTWRRPERSAEDERFLTDPSTHRRSRYIPSLRELAINAIPEGPEQDAAWHLASHGDFPADEM
eukprot:jgi/Mesvir1/17035/Mv16564-RA.1